MNINDFIIKKCKNQLERKHALKIHLSEKEHDQDLKTIVEELSSLKLACEILIEENNLLKKHLEVINIPVPHIEPILSNGSFKKNCLITADMIKDKKTGFYDLEYSSENIPFRWTGPSQTFSISFQVNRSTPVKYTLHLHGNTEAVRNAKIKIKCDGYQEALKLNGNVLSGTLPPNISPITKLSFTVPHSFIPSHLSDESSDDRTLVVAFQSLKISEL